MVGRIAELPAPATDYLIGVIQRASMWSRFDAVAVTLAPKRVSRGLVDRRHSPLRDADRLVERLAASAEQRLRRRDPVLASRRWGELQRRIRCAEARRARRSEVTSARGTTGRGGSGTAETADPAARRRGTTAAPDRARRAAVGGRHDGRRWNRRHDGCRGREHDGARVDVRAVRSERNGCRGGGARNPATSRRRGRRGRGATRTR